MSKHLRRLLLCTLLIYLVMAGCGKPRIPYPLPPEEPVSRFERKVTALTTVPLQKAALPPGSGPRPTVVTAEPLPQGLALSAPDRGALTGLHWLGEGRVLLVWEEEEEAVELSLPDGRVEPLPRLGEVNGASPDGRWLFFRPRTDLPTHLLDRQTGAVWKMPRFDRVDTGGWPGRWVTPGLVVLATADWPQLVDLQAITVRSDYSNNYLTMRALAGGELCYGTGGVFCGGLEGLPHKVLAYPRSPYLEGRGPIPDPADIRVAYTNVRLEPNAQLFWASFLGVQAAHATPPEPPPPPYGVDTLSVYDPKAGKVRNFELPGHPLYVRRLLWSADGARIGLQVEAPGPQGESRPQEFLLLELATGRFTRLGSAGTGEIFLERVLEKGVLYRQGELLFQLTGEGEPIPWQGGAPLVPALFPPTLPEPGAGRDLILRGDGELRVYGPDWSGRWPLEGLSVEQAALSPDRQWLAVRTPEGRIAFLRRGEP
ncbi:MAG: hypothetical protein ACOY93_13295 [Bacillota bacterium]